MRVAGVVGNILSGPRAARVLIMIEESTSGEDTDEDGDGDTGDGEEGKGLRSFPGGHKLTWPNLE